ncbi:MAG: thiamine pyrophosphate-dependent enzyme [Saprospiraceae bacterium]|nr:thiamine pyrophosphate-dependent enzyme [Saprospiraceae bacterium]
MIETQFAISPKILKKAFRLMSTAKHLTELYEENSKTVSKYVHATSRGHEAIQIATGLQLTSKDFVAPYYRDDALLLSIGCTPLDLMLQVLAKKEDPFSGGRTYYSHPSLKDVDKPTIPHQSSATGMQAIPLTGVAMGLQYKEKTGLSIEEYGKNPIAICSIGDAAMTEGEIAEALQMAALKQFPVIYLVQDNGWDISANKEETRAMDADEYAKGFPGIETRSINGSNFDECYVCMKEVIEICRTERRPFLVHAKVPLLNHHTSGVRKEWYRDDLEEHASRDPYPILKNTLQKYNVPIRDIEDIEIETKEYVNDCFEKAQLAEDPSPSDLFTHDFAPTPIQKEIGTRQPQNGEEKVMVDCALIAVQELMEEHPECLLYGQDVGARLGGVFREAATLAQKFGDARVFNTPIQEAFIVGSTVGMSAVGLKPIVEVQFADYIWPGLNQLFSEVSRSCYLSNGKFPVSMILRVPIGAYGSGGPYHSSSVESILTNIRGIKIAYPSNGADMKGLMKAAYYDPNPVIMLEHKGLYWSKVKGTDKAKTIMPDKDYILPLGKGKMILESSAPNKSQGNNVLVVAYGMGVHWALNASKKLEGHIGILDLRSLYPLDEELIFEQSKEYGRILVVTEEPVFNGFAQSIASRIQQECFEYLDAPVRVVGAENMPAIPLNETLEKTMIPSAEKVEDAIIALLNY